ncbi:MAG: dockerin type I repeat-containing protein [Oscillospiraceae bacterium]|nr:dockerin type I repeat-containing protein [Oscillospiraceae bacterium]
MKKAVISFCVFLVVFLSVFTHLTASAAFSRGDVNNDGALDAVDARLILRHVAKLDTLTGAALKAADVDGSGEVDAGDARIVLRVTAKLQKLPDISGANPQKPSNSGGASLEQMLASGTAVQYQRVACHDKEMGCEAIRSVAPAGWKADGQVYWAFQSGAAPATTDFYIVSPDNSARAGRVSNMSFVVPDPNYNQMSEGQWYSPALASVKQYQNAETYAQNFFKEYTDIADMQLVGVEYPKGETAKALEAYRMYMQQELDNTLAQMAPQNSQMSVECSINAAQVTLRFETNGVPCKARIFVAISSYVNTNTQDIPYVGRYTTQETGWNTGPAGFLYYMAEESKFDRYEAASEMFFSNLIVNEQWGSAVQQLSTKLFQEQIQSTFEQLMQKQQEHQQMCKRYVDASKPSYSNSGSGSSGYSSKVMDGWNNAVTDREYFSTDDGGYTKLDSSYMNTYSNGSDFVQSNSSLDMPSGWNKVGGSTMIP